MRFVSLSGHIFTFIAVAIWSVAFVGNKILLDYLSPIEIMLYRFILAWALLLLLYPKGFIPRSFRDEAYFFLLGFLGIYIYFLLENFALSYTQASNVGLYMGAIPILTALLAHSLLKEERFRPSLLFGFILALIGMGLILFSERHFSIRLKGDLLALAAAASFALYSVALKRTPKRYHFLLIARKSFFYGILLMLLTIMLDSKESHILALYQSVVWGNLLFLGLFSSGLAFVLWQQGIERIGPILAGNYIYLIPLLTALSGVAILHEKITLSMILGGALILAGLYVAQQKW